MMRTIAKDLLRNSRDIVTEDRSIMGIALKKNIIMFGTITMGLFGIKAIKDFITSAKRFSKI